MSVEHAVQMSTLHSMQEASATTELNLFLLRSTDMTTSQEADHAILFATIF